MTNKQALLDYIKNLNLEPGSRIPTETEFCNKFSLTRYRVRQLINELAEEHKWVKIQGSGTYLPGGKESYRPIEKTILVLTPLLHDHIYDWLAPMHSIATQAGFHLLNLNVQHQQLELENESLVQLVQRRIHSLVLEPYPGNPEVFSKIDQLQAAGTRCILLNAPDKLKSQYPVYDFNYRKAGYMAVVYLMRKGAKRIVHIGQYKAIAWQFAEFRSGVQEAAQDFKMPLECCDSYLIVSSPSGMLSWEPPDFKLPLYDDTGYVSDDGYYGALAIFSQLRAADLRNFSMITVGWNKYLLPFANLFFDNTKRMLDIVNLLTQSAFKSNNFRRTIDPELIEPNYADGAPLSFRL